MARLAAHPVDSLWRRWNWKSALLSSIFRANLFFAVNVTAGARRALAAAAAEFLLRFAASGFYGGLTESFRNAEPPWAAALVVSLLLPAVSHSMELLVHWLRGTPHLRSSIIASICFTGVSTAFNWFAMRKGALVVGEGQCSLWSDLARMPRLLLEFFRAIGLAITGRSPFPEAQVGNENASFD